MASDKKRRKTIKRIREQEMPPVGPFRHRDGDRRRRGGPSAKEAVAWKQRMREFGGLIPPVDESEGDGD
jgi:hypothetical protein